MTKQFRTRTFALLKRTISRKLCQSRIVVVLCFCYYLALIGKIHGQELPVVQNDVDCLLGEPVVLLDGRTDIPSLRMYSIINPVLQTAYFEIELDVSRVLEVGYKGGWAAIAFPPDGSMSMVPNIAIIGLPSDGVVTMYSMSDRAPAGVVPFLSSTNYASLGFTDMSVTQNSTITLLSFTRTLQVSETTVALDDGTTVDFRVGNITIGQPSTIVWAYGSYNFLAYHANRGSSTLTLDVCDDTTSSGNNNSTTTAPATTPSPTTTPGMNMPQPSLLAPSSTTSTSNAPTEALLTPTVDPPVPAAPIVSVATTTYIPTVVGTDSSTSMIGPPQLVEPTTVQVPTTKCFESNDELRMAIHEWFNTNRSTTSNVSLLYGFPIGKWCVDAITNFTEIFKDQTSFTGTEGDDISGWNVSSGVSFRNIFHNCYNFAGSLFLWDTSKAVDMSGMFYNCHIFQFDLYNFNTSACTDMSYMFYNAKQFSSALFNFNFASVTNMSYMLAGMESFNTNVYSWDTKSLIDVSGMFRDNILFNNSVFPNTTLVTDMSYMFAGATAYTDPEGSIYNWNTTNVRNMSHMFDGATSFSKSLYDIDVSNVIDMSYMFYNATSFDASLFPNVTTNCQTLSYMFAYATSYTDREGSLYNWDTSSVTSMDGMFFHAINFNSSSISTFNVSSVTNMSYMFAYAETFNNNDMTTDNKNDTTNKIMSLSEWDTSSVIDYSYMFANATSFQINLCSWSTGIVSATASSNASNLNFQNMFSNTSCPYSSNNPTIDVTAINTSIENTTSMNIMVASLCHVCDGSSSSESITSPDVRESSSSNGINPMRMITATNWLNNNCIVQFVGVCVLTVILSC